MGYENPFDIAREQMYPTPYQNSTLLPLLLLSLATQKHTPDTTKYIRREYDYIIVGAGSAGSVVASRLSEMPCVNVLLLEAGDPPPLLTEIPSIARSFIMSDMDWNYLTEPQKCTGAGLNNRQMTWPSGKAVGGSSVLNGMMAVRGTREDYDGWEKLGAKGWSWKNVLPYFIKMEDNTDPYIASNGFHGVGGPVTISTPPYRSYIRKAIIDAAHFLGYPYGDTNTGIEYGFSHYQGNIRRGQRCSTAKAYLVPREKCTNLDIVSGAFVTKRKWLRNASRFLSRKSYSCCKKWTQEVGQTDVASKFGIPKSSLCTVLKNREKIMQFAEKSVPEKVHNIQRILFNGKTAVGVQFDHSGHRYEVGARKEVIMSAGTVNTAQLLILSGIGPKKTLQRFQIPEVANLPVGLNFHDHAAPFMTFVVNAAIPPFLQKLVNPKNIKLYINEKVGPLASMEGISGVAFFPNNRWEHPGSPPDHQIVFAEADVSIPRTQFNMIPSVYQQVFGPYENRTVLWCVSSLLHPKSRGYVSIRSTNPYDPPVIDPNYFAHPDDVYSTVSGLKACLRIAETPSMKKLGVQPFETVIPGCEKFVKNEDDYLECMTRSIVFTLSHQVGTAKMGDPWDPTTVVDPELRVKGVKGLRVVDASVMPKVPSGNTNIPVIMLAEKASDIIKDSVDCYNDWLST